MKPQKYLLFVNLRRLQKEAYAMLSAVKELKYGILLLANKEPSANLRPLIDQVILADTFDQEASLEKARQLAQTYLIAGVPSVTEVDVPLCARITQALGLPGLPVEAALKARNKYHMRQALKNLPELIPRFQKIDRFEELSAALETISYPAILKPTGASGSKGIFRVDTPEDGRRAFEKLSQITQPAYDEVFRQFGGELILEEYIEGVEFTVEGFVFQGEVVTLGITDKRILEPFSIEYFHIFPSNFPESTQQEIIKRSELVVKELGFDYCAFHLEARWSEEKGFKLIEVAARPAGGYIASHLVRKASGIDMYKDLIRISLGRKPLLERACAHYAGVRFILAEREGVLKGFEGFAELCGLPMIEEVAIAQPLGTSIELPPKHFTVSVVAGIIIKSPHYEHCAEWMEEAAKLLRPVVC